MPKRIGFLYERFLTEENFILGEKLMAKNKDNKTAKYIGENAEKFGKELFEKYSAGRFAFSRPRERTIREGYKGKERHLKIPCLEDQAVQQSWLNIAIPFIMKRNYYYNCGSIPGAGQSRAVKGVKRFLSDPAVKYAAVTDIKKFYDTCPHKAVIDGLRRIFKDEKFIAVAKAILDSMSDDGIGIAIGYPVSHWFANVALTHIDKEMKRRFPKVKFARYMDDTVFVSANKRHICRCVHKFKADLEGIGLKLKYWQVFHIKDRGVSFLSYRFFNGYTLLRKPLMMRISRRFKRAGQRINIHVARGLESYKGILKPCNSYHFEKERVRKYTNFKLLERMISSYEKDILRRTAACG